MAHVDELDTVDQKEEKAENGTPPTNAMIKRQLGAVMGVLVADAGSMPLHWVYKDQVMDKAIYQKTNDNKTWKMADFAFMQRNRNPYYKLPTGRNSNYSDQLYVTLQSLYENKGFDAAQWKKALYTAFGGEENIYQTSRKLRDETPVNGPWLHVAMIDFCRKYEAKEDDTASRHNDNDGLANAIPVVTYLATTGGFVKAFPEDKIRGVISSIIKTPDVVVRSTFICKLLWEIITTGTIRTREDFANLLYREREQYLNKEGVQEDNAVQKVYREVRGVMKDAGFMINEHGKMVYDASKRKFKSQREAVSAKKLGYGKPCGNPGSFKGPLHNVLINGDDYKKAVLAEIESGGDNCSRLHITGSLIGAMHGVDCVPSSWIKKTLVADEALKMCNDLFEQNDSVLDID